MLPLTAPSYPSTSTCCRCDPQLSVVCRACVLCFLQLCTALPLSQSRCYLPADGDPLAAPFDSWQLLQLAVGECTEQELSM